MSGRTIWYVVGDVTDPAAEPFVLMSVDTSVKRDGGWRPLAVRRYDG